MLRSEEVSTAENPRETLHRGITPGNWLGGASRQNAGVRASPGLSGLIHGRTSLPVGSSDKHQSILGNLANRVLTAERIRRMQRAFRVVTPLAIHQEPVMVWT